MRQREALDTEELQMQWRKRVDKKKKDTKDKRREEKNPGWMKGWKLKDASNTTDVILLKGQLKI